MLSPRYDLGKTNPQLEGMQTYLNLNNVTDKACLHCGEGCCNHGIEAP